MIKTDANNFFIFQEPSNTIDGYWKATKNGDSFKIYGFLEQDHHLHLTFVTQTWAQWFFSNLVTVFTCGYVRDYFRDEQKIDCHCAANVEEMKKIITSGYQEMMALTSLEKGVNDVALRLLNRLSENPPEIDSVPLTSAQLVYTEKLKNSTIEIVKVVLTFFMDPRVREMSPDELKELVEMAQEDYPVIIEERTKKFFNCMMNSVDLMLNDLKGMKESFEQLASVSGDGDIRNKLVQSIAFGYIKKLMEELDLEDVSIVDQMIR